MTVKYIHAKIRAIKAEMKDKGIRRISCFNSGHSPESYRLNSELFALGVALVNAKTINK